MEKIKELFVNKEIAILAVQKGFKEPVIGFFDMETDALFPSIQRVSTLIEAFEEPKEKYKNYLNDSDVFIDYIGYFFEGELITDEYPAITYDQLLKWFREKHNINIIYIVCGGQKEVFGYKWFIQIKMENQAYETKMIKNYYEGINEVFEQAFKIIK